MVTSLNPKRCPQLTCESLVSAPAARRCGDGMREGARPSGRWCRTGQPQVGDDRTGAALQRNEEHERVTVLLDGGPQDAGHDRLRGGAARRAVAATHLAGDDGGPDSLFGLP